MASDPRARVLTGGIAIIKVKGKVVGLMKNISINDNIQRAPVYELGSILPVEAPVTKWAGSISCSFFEINYGASGIKDAIRRDVGSGNAASQIASGIATPNFEDNLVLDAVGVQLDLYKKMEDIGSPDPNTGLLIPTKKPYALISRCMIESDNVNIDDGSVAGRTQSFNFLDPIVYDPI